MLESFSELFDVLKESQEAVEKGIENGLQTAGARIVGTAKEKLGSYQPAIGPYNAWSKLKVKSVRAKNMSKSETNKVENALYVTAKGDIRFRRHLSAGGKKYLKKHGSFGAGGNDDAPLVDTGYLKQSITVDAKEVGKGIIYVGVGSGQKDAKGSSPGGYAAVHEFGYAPKNIPARPFIRPSVYENREEIKEDIAEAIKEELESIWQNN